MEYLDISKLEKAQARELLYLLQAYKATPDSHVLGYLYQVTRGAAEAAVTACTRRSRTGTLTLRSTEDWQTRQPYCSAI